MRAAFKIIWFFMVRRNAALVIACYLHSILTAVGNIKGLQPHTKLNHQL